MTREQEQNTDHLAKRAAAKVLMGDVAPECDAQWWAAELSYRLGIVSSSGMIDVSGEVARRFARSFNRAMKAGI